MRFITPFEGEAPDKAADKALSLNGMPCVVSVSCRNTWSDSGDIPLLVAFERDLTDSALRCLIAADNDYSLEVFELAGCLDDAAEELALPVFAENQAVHCIPHREAKPWGEEIWFTGIEKRGISEVGNFTASVPLPWLLASVPSWFNDSQALILLKILAPRPEPVWGDLYLELHREKQEVYVITSINHDAWPDGRGQIRLGVPPEKVSNSVDKQIFIDSFSSAISDYRTCRFEIDQALDRCRQRDGLALNAPVEPERQQQWLAELPVELVEREGSLREALFDHTQLHELVPGDVVKVPTLTPHSLQHGVRAVEFQTPVYERLIVAFAQKVLTQEHWDSEEALELMNLDARLERSLETVHQAQGCRVDSVVRFDDFSVDRVTLSGGGHYRWSSDAYSIWMGIAGAPALAGSSLQPEQAVLLPAGASEYVVSHEGDEEWVFLVATPRLRSES